ncbi:hypothetical protein LTR05_004566 [Lithohypha guttulata]|uniref:DUF4045 domain-containing protein n=1 Tax=Lithohypha guttulata TaxID=1690604 RepID=A0AAN7T0B5_9EURO|nr:hypothetical protein LTR05_004566 [Lithohypha guttulata]
MSSNNDGSESVDQFLARIASVKENDEASANTRRMDEEFLKGRQERQARRLERARSISPSKTGPAKTSSTDLTPSTIATSTQAINPPIDFSPQAPILTRSNAVNGRTSPTRSADAPRVRAISTSPKAEPASASPTATGLARSGTLSWQQRPASRDGLRQRPLSAFAPSRGATRLPTEPEKDAEPSRADIAASLAQKDPAWFRQTQERGTSSAAYRKNQVEDTPEAPLARSMQLPGLSQSREPSKSPAPERRPDQPTRLSADTVQETDRFKRGTTPDIAALRLSMIEKPLTTKHSSPENAVIQPPSLETPNLDASVPSLARSSSTLLHNRPPSPTKGLGGFVESAMMRRSDSVSKRWSVKDSSGLKRGDSVAGGRPVSLHSRGISRDIHSSRADTPSSPLANSRPGSSHKQEPLASPEIESTTNLPSNPTETVKEELSQAPPKPKEVTPIDTARPRTPTDDSLLSRSPSKTMDPRRWSPTKSTWLESALQQKPETPKLQPLKEEQPKWKVDLQRSKSRASRDISPEKPPKLEKQPGSPILLKSKSIVASPVVPAAANSSSTSTPNMPKDSAELPPEAPQTASSKGSQATGSVHVENEESDVVQDEEPANQKKLKDTTSNSASRQLPVLKPKPQTPPKTDFRATLKSRTQGPTTNTGEEPEFRSMFGKLKRTTTQNYVAPDELKHNIMSGKAALNTTSGPVKTKRIDEFKESILAKKEEMRAAGPLPVQRPDQKDKIEFDVPEALARRKTLSKGSTTDSVRVKTSPSDQASRPEKPALTPKPLTTRRQEMSSDKQTTPTTVIAVKDSKPKSVPGKMEQHTTQKNVSIADEDKLVPTIQSTESTHTPAALATSTNRSTQVQDAMQPPVLRALKSSTQPTSSNATSTTSIDSPALTGLPAGSKLASRLNPNLAAMLSRGSSPKPQTTSNAANEDTTAAPAIVSSQAAAQDDGSLTHMTKGRAKGPKRRAPKTEAAVPERPIRVLSEQPIVAKSEDKLTSKITPKEKESSPVVTRQSFKQTVTNPKPSIASSVKVPAVDKNISLAPVLSQEIVQPKTPSKQTPSLDEVFEKNLQSEQTTTKSLAVESKSKPLVASKSPELRKVSSPPSFTGRLAVSPKPVTPPKPASETISKPIPKPDAASTPVATPELGKDKSTEMGKAGLTKVLVKKEIRPLPKPEKSSSIQGLGLKMTPSPQPPKLSPKPRTLTPPPDTDMRISGHEFTAIRDVLEDYVGSITKDCDRAEFDAQRFLESTRQVQSRTKTTQHTVYEVSGDGKKTLVLSEHQHILYEDAMYLIAHRYTTESGSATADVHLWCGGRVSDAAIDDAQVFCRRDAREHNTKLDVVRQGKESASFMQGFGGILIVRRSKSSALYMLCGRRHLGHIVFDEVDMDAGNLCPGFAFLVSAAYGKLYLWKGKGAGVDEIGSARLIGMDLGLTGEIEEVDQGSESLSFWEALGGKKQQHWSSVWNQRSETSGHHSALYRVEHERPGMLTSLASWGLKRAASPAKQQLKATCEQLQPYCQSDLDTPAIHILDNYRSLYVILTRQCTSKAAEFVTALSIAQDIAMLSPAIQDRPVLPTCYVVAGNMPNDVKACFRKWSALESASVAGKDSICVRVEEVMEALEL